MKILFFADGRSPTALNWISYFLTSPHEVHLVSSYPCDPPAGLASFHVVTAAFSGAAGRSGSTSGGGSLIKRLSTPRMRTAVRQWLGVFTLSRAARQLRQVIEQADPDLVHAIRIPYEGMVAAMALAAEPTRPLLVSIWGNDFTLHAPSSPMMGRRTRGTLGRANAIHADCRRDIRLAHEWGFPLERSFTVLPGGGGIQLDQFSPAENPDDDAPPLVINPRGLRAYVHNETFFRAIPLVLKEAPTAHFICPAMQGAVQAEAWVKELGIEHAVTLLPQIPRSEMAALFRKAQVTVSLTSHDGTPNTLLEAMACGSFPIAGNIESVREWITNGKNGLLVDPDSPEQAAQAILAGLANPGLRNIARQENRTMVTERAAYDRVMPQAEAFYVKLAGL